MPTPELLQRARALDPEPIADLAMRFLHIWSPPGDEAAMARAATEALSAAGAQVRLEESDPASPSVVGVLGDGQGPTLQWHGHLDAIDVAHTLPERVGDELVGRGAADMKGPLAAMVAAVGLLRDLGYPRGGRLLITFHGKHESGGSEPLRALFRQGIHGDAVITGELGGGRELPLGGLGLTFWEAVIERPGMALHETVAGPDDLDPVEVARQLHGALAELRERLRARRGPSLFVGQSSAGDYFNRLPNRAVLRGTRRHDTDESLADVEAELRALVAAVEQSTGASIELTIRSVAEAFDVDPGSMIARSVRRAHAELFGTELEVVRSRVATNAVHFVTEVGIPAVCYGPDHATNHSDREALPVAELSRLAAGFAVASALWFEAGGEVSPATAGPAPQD